MLIFSLQCCCGLSVSNDIYTSCTRGSSSIVFFFSVVFYRIVQTSDELKKKQSLPVNLYKAGVKKALRNYTKWKCTKSYSFKQPKMKVKIKRSYLHIQVLKSKYLGNVIFYLRSSFSYLSKNFLDDFRFEAVLFQSPSLPVTCETNTNR